MSKICIFAPYYYNAIVQDSAMRNHSDQRSNEAKNIILPHDNKKDIAPELCL